MPRRRTGPPAGKLRAAARRWAGGRGGAAARSNDPLTQAAEAPSWRTAEVDEALELTRDQADTIGLFIALDTQWRCHPMTGTRLGIDYSAIEPTARMMEIKMTPQLLPDIRAMELAALDELARLRT